MNTTYQSAMQRAEAVRDAIAVTDTVWLLWTSLRAASERAAELGKAADQGSAPDAESIAAIANELDCASGLLRAVRMELGRG